MDLVYIHLILQSGLIVFWAYTIFNTIRSRKNIPVNLLGTILMAEVIVIYILTTNLPLFTFSPDRVIWRRYEWYAFDLITAIIINQIISLGDKLHRHFNWLTKRKNL